MNPVTFVHYSAAVIAIILAVPLMWYGVRIPASFASEEEWLRINEYGGRQLLLWGILIAGVASVGLFIRPEHWVTYNWVSLAIVLASLALATARVLRFASVRKKPIQQPQQQRP
jgi:uncharacterized membrane protein